MCLLRVFLYTKRVFIFVLIQQSESNYLHFFTASHDSKISDHHSQAHAEINTHSVHIRETQHKKRTNHVTHWRTTPCVTRAWIAWLRCFSVTFFERAVMLTFRGVHYTWPLSGFLRWRFLWKKKKSKAAKTFQFVFGSRAACPSWPVGPWCEKKWFWRHTLFDWLASWTHIFTNSKLISGKIYLRWSLTKNLSITTPKYRS